MPSERSRKSHQELRARIIRAAVKVVSRHGYAKASMARIAEEAGIAYGSIYLHFRNQQDLFLQLLPSVSEDLRKAIRHRSHGARTFMEHETIGFDVLFDSALQNPGRRRVLTEAPFFVPEAYDAYLARMSAAYERVMRACKARGDLAGLEPADFEVVAYSLMGAKQFLLEKYCNPEDPPDRVPPKVRDSYLRFVERAVSGG